MENETDNYPYSNNLCARACGILFLVASAITHGSEGLSSLGLKAVEPTRLALYLQQKSTSDAVDDIAEIGNALSSVEQLLKLNTQEEYNQLPAHLLAVYPILMNIAGNESSAAQNLIADLSRSEVFLAEPGRLEGLLRVLPHIHVLPTEAINLLRDTMDPDSENLEIAIDVIFETGNPAALELFVDQASNEEQDIELVQGWMRGPMLRHRADPAVIQMSIDLLTMPRLDRERKNALVEAMFDYQPQDWYLTPESDDQSLPEPPALNDISEKARNLLSELVKVTVADEEVSFKNKILAKQFITRF